MTTPRSSARSRLRTWVVRETSGGILLLAAAAVALVWANSPWAASYHGISETIVGPAALHLNLDIAAWAADGLLAIFFFAVGLELKHEIVAGSLRDIRSAAVPVIAAVGGMVMPAVIFAGVVVGRGQREALDGWAIPTATDIAFALAVLAVFGRGLPRALRTFLLTLAVVDDLLAIVVIAAFYTEEIHFLPLAAALILVAAFALVVRRRRLHGWLLLPLFVTGWAFMHASGVHATIAGVLMGLTVPAVAIHGERMSRTHYLESRIKPWSAGLVLPVFAFFSAGVPLGSSDDSESAFTQPMFAAILLGLLIGKFVGVMGTTALVTRLTPLRLPDAIGMRDLLPVGLLTGIGFTVSLLIAELSFEQEALTGAAKLGVLAGSTLAAVAGAVALRWNASLPRSADMNLDGKLDKDTAPITSATPEEDGPTVL